MGFSRVRFNNFRNIEPREIKWSPGLNLLTGANGSGKTNILEGINIIAGWGPLERGTRTASLPTWNSGSEVVQLTGQLDGPFGDIIQVRIEGRASMRFNEKQLSAAELRWKTPVLSFLPNDMAILEDSASYRRRMLDMLLAILIPAYAMRLHEYRRGVRQKAAMLKRGVPTRIVDRALEPHAVWIWRMRQKAVELLSECLAELGGLVPVKVDLKLSRGGAGFCSDEEEDYRRGLAENESREQLLKVCLTGPHRDDLAITVKGMPAAEALSRGYRRRTAIALMLASSDGVRRKLGKEPVLLLDEVTAELDEEGRGVLFAALAARRTQAFAATAEPFIGGFPGAVYSVSEGRVDLKNETGR